MALIHFCFGSHHRAGNYQSQLEHFIEYIVLPRKLRASVCPEFLPFIRAPGALTGDFRSARPGDGVSVIFDRWVPGPPVNLLPCDIWMVCFADIPLNKLRHWEPSRHYGQLGIVFTNEFRRRHCIRRVSYYQYHSLAKDRIVIDWNRAVHLKDDETRERLAQLILHFRKPSRLWGDFKDLFSSIEVTGGLDSTAAIDVITYNRYPVGYNFEEEYEARWVASEENCFLPFTEQDVLQIVVPDKTMKREIEGVLQAVWSEQPAVVEYPK